MPCDYKKYPANWKTEIGPAILYRAGQRIDPDTGFVIERARCEQCNARNLAYGYRDKTGDFWEMQDIEDRLNEGQDLFDPGEVLEHCWDKMGNPTKPVRIVLTISHTDHDTTNNNPRNLRALCQRCHIHHDRELHMANARATRVAKTGQIEIQWQQN